MNSLVLFIGSLYFSFIWGYNFARRNIWTACFVKVFHCVNWEGHFEGLLSLFGWICGQRQELNIRTVASTASQLCMQELLLLLS